MDRVGGAKAFLGSILSIKPIITVRDGEVHEGGKVKTRSRAIQFLLDKVKATKTNNDFFDSMRGGR